MSLYAKILEVLMVIATVFLLLALLTLGFSRAVTATSIGIASGVSILVFLKEPKSFFKQLASQPVAWFCLLLIIIFYIGVLHTNNTPMTIRLHSAKKYLWYLYPILMMPLTTRMFTKEKWTVAALNCLMWNAIALAVIGITAKYSDAFYHWILHAFPFGARDNYGPTSPILQHTDAGFFSAFSAYLAFCLMIRIKKYRLYYLLCFCLLSYYCLFVNIGRTGYMVYILLATTFCFQHYYPTFQRLILSLVVLVVVFSVIYVLSPQLRQLDHLVKTMTNSQMSSFKVRYAEFKTYLIAWKQAPVLGRGTGFAPVSRYPKITGAGQIRTRDVAQYADVMMQTGLIGLAILFGLLISMFYTGFKFKDLLKRYVAQAFAIVTAFFALISSNFTFDPDSYMIVLLLAILYLPQGVITWKRQSDTNVKIPENDEEQSG